MQFGAPTGRALPLLIHVIRAIRGLSASTIQRGEANFLRNPALISVLYFGERPEITPHDEEPNKAKTTKKKN